MRTTVTLDDALHRELKRRARESGLPFKEVVDRTLRAGLSALDRPTRRRRYRLTTHRMGRPLVGLNDALRRGAALEDEERVREARERRDGEA